MADITPAAALRQLQQAQAGLRKARHALREAREHEADVSDLADVLRLGWNSLTEAHRLMAEVPSSAATEPVMTKQLAVQRYATSLLVRLRRLVRHEPGALDSPDEEDFEDDE